jgi:hypothetical protein
MADTYLAISQIANDQYMTERMNSAATQQWHLESVDLGQYGNNPYNVTMWVKDNRYLWASSPSWGEKWDYALASHPDQPDYEPGKDAAVITDADILAAVQQLAGTD